MESPATRNATLKQLLEKGVRIPSPESVEIGSDLHIQRISGENVTIHAGCKVSGKDTLILPGVELGYEAPVTVLNCQLGRDVKLKGGFFEESCFLEGVIIGSGAQVRKGCLLEEKARAGHTVGLKQTILFPFVTLGSLINFCDCLMAGGTDEKNHSEVGSSYIHFNYTPDQDKATPSLIGDVSRGVMLNQAPIFLGGQGGLVGPVRIEYGVVVAAGIIVRKDLLREGRILLGQPAVDKSVPFHRGLYSNVQRIVGQNTLYLGNLIALRRWYKDVRIHFVEPDSMEGALLEAAVEKLECAVEERLYRLRQVAERMPRSIEISKRISSIIRTSEKAVQRKKEFHEKWGQVEKVFKESLNLEGDPLIREKFQRIIEKGIGKNGGHYLRVIKGLSPDEAKLGSTWLQGIIDKVVERIENVLPSFSLSK